VSATALADLADLAVDGAVTLHEPLDMFSAEAMSVSLPLEHMRLLARSNGVEAYSGYFRVFGIGTRAGIDLQAWNDPGLWKQAWKGRADGWLCFGETGWGDQYAYRGDAGGGTVFRLDAFSMEPEPIASGFSEWMRRVLLPNAQRPRDELTVSARERLGRLPVAEHVTFLRPPAGCEVDPATVARVPAVAAMRAAAEAWALRGAGDGA
jgi:hypothetical protein